ncbi:MAG: MFS transporter [Theionarchaea archaeon]|nr:MFS transporter [Theionarchaea archaeon]MBU7000995.1 MFS transporter [Theionarchaea archaeon]MBU7020988.1 MFS transporter [Theionarchaea archaeon]MBU7034373.1 MFS transporter [Theionarchaea archaeon]MBU7040063.1 MFS transporter [Theionarchaea archaeon]
MNLSHEKSDGSYKWYVLGLGSLTHALVVAMPVMCMPVLFNEISEDLGLSLVQVGAIWGVASVSGMFSGLVGGSAGDRFGIRHTVSIACLLAGVAGAARGISGDSLTLTVTSFIYGFLPPAITPNIHKMCGVWFPGKRLGMANGVVSAGMALGFMMGSLVSATVLSPWLGGWRNVLFFYGALSVAVGIPWWKVRSSPDESSVQEGSRVSLRKALPHVGSLRSVWAYGLITLGIGSCIQGSLGYLPLYLRALGWAGPSADGALATFHGVSLLFTIPLALLSDRCGSRKGILVIATVMTIGGVGFLSIADGMMIWVLVLLAGIVRDGYMAILMTMVIETEGIGAKYAGTAMGMTAILYRFGGFFSPPLGNSLAALNLGLPFVFWAGTAALAFLGLYFVREHAPG